MKIEIPEFLAHLPVEERGYPVPYFVPWVNGKPFFKAASEEKHLICYKNKLCGICGKKIKSGEFCFVGGPQALKNKCSSEAHTHFRCAKYALQVCPYLFHQKSDRKWDGDGHDLNKDVMILDKPEAMYIMVSNKVEWYNDGKHRLFRFRLIRAHEFKYIDKKLTETGEIFRFKIF